MSAPTIYEIEKDTNRHEDDRARAESLYHDIDFCSIAGTWLSYIRLWLDDADVGVLHIDHEVTRQMFLELERRYFLRRGSRVEDAL